MKVVPLFKLIDCGPSKGFDQFWAEYPKKAAKLDAARAFMRAVHGGTPPEALIEGAKRFAFLCRRERTERQYIPHPATWLNGGRWEDEDLATCIVPTQEEIDAAKDKADRLLRRGKYATQTP
jgi:hypothetical protein